MNFLEFIELAEGKKADRKEYKRQLGAVMDHARYHVGGQTAIQTTMDDSHIHSSTKTLASGRKAIIKQRDQREKEYQDNKKKGIKRIIKGLKESDTLRAIRAREAQQEREEKMKKLADKQAKRGQDAKLGHVGIPMPNSGSVLKKSTKDKYSVDTSRPKMNVHKF